MFIFMLVKMKIFEWSGHLSILYLSVWSAC